MLVECIAATLIVPEFASETATLPETLLIQSA